MNNIFKWVKAAAMWLVIAENRAVAIKYTRKAIDLMDIAATLTDSKDDDKSLKKIRKNMEKVVDVLPSALALKTIKKINAKTKGPLKTVNIGFNEKEGFRAGIDIRF